MFGCLFQLLHWRQEKPKIYSSIILAYRSIQEINLNNSINKEKVKVQVIWDMTPCQFFNTNISEKFYKQTNKMHFFVCIYSTIRNSTCFERLFRSSLGVHKFTISAARLHGVYKAADTANLWTPDDERNSRSKHVELCKNCRINTYRKYILLVFLYNWLRCTVDTLSNFGEDFCLVLQCLSRSWTA